MCKRPRRIPIHELVAEAKTEAEAKAVAARGELLQSVGAGGVSFCYFVDFADFTDSNSGVDLWIYEFVAHHSQSQLQT